MTTTTLLHRPQGFQGDVITPASAGYDAARRVWNHAIDRYPAAILRCTCTEDVRLGLALAREHGLVVAVRGGGHSMAGLSTCDDGLVIDLSPMTAITVDPVRRTALAEPGLLWRDFDRATQEHGLAVPGGEVSDTGIAGLTLGGGIGWLGRKHGLSCDNLRAVTMVTAAGDVVRASHEENSELFWGMRGAGANFGIVTSLEYDLHPVGPLYGGELIHPGFRGVDALRSMVDLAPTMPDEVRLMAALVTAPHAPFVPAEAQGKPVCVLAAAHCGPVDEGERVLAPLREFGPPVVDTMRPQPYVELQQSVDKMIPPGRNAYVKSDFLGRLDDQTLQVLAEHHARATSPYCQILLHQMGGAIARVPADATAFVNRDAEWMMTVIAIWLDPDEQQEPHVAWARGLWEAMRPWATGTYVNHLGDEGEQRVREAYGSSYTRLVALKEAWDPQDVFRLNQHIAPRTRI
jgi:FAD binding domain/Berberine and berberine like